MSKYTRFIEAVPTLYPFPELNTKVKSKVIYHNFGAEIQIYFKGLRLYYVVYPTNVNLIASLKRELDKKYPVISDTYINALNNFDASIVNKHYSLFTDRFYIEKHKLSIGENLLLHSKPLMSEFITYVKYQYLINSIASIIDTSTPDNTNILVLDNHLMSYKTMVSNETYVGSGRFILNVSKGRLATDKEKQLVVSKQSLVNL